MVKLRRHGRQHIDVSRWAIWRDLAETLTECSRNAKLVEKAWSIPCPEIQ